MLFVSEEPYQFSKIKTRWIKSHRRWESRPLSFRKGVVFKKFFRSRGYYRSSARIQTFFDFAYIRNYEQRKLLAWNESDATAVVLKGIPTNIPRTRMLDNVLPQERACYNGNTFRRGAWYTTRWRGELDARFLGQITFKFSARHFFRDWSPGGRIVDAVVKMCSETML